MRRTVSRVIRSKSRRATFARFACVGSAIALIDAGGLYLLHWFFDVSVYLARLVSYSTAMTAGYFLNRHFTFHHRERVREIWDELLRFYSVHALGGLLNYGVFFFVVTMGKSADLGPALTAWLPAIGVWVGGIFGMCFNFLFSHKLVFDE